MTPADKRVLEQLDRWLTSIELHLKYVDLDEAGYRQVQPWPAHERPARWILELAQQKVLQLKSLCKAQIANNDPAYAESLELMGFLANLVGSQQVNRFIPLAEPASERSITASASEAGKSAASTTPPADDATRELPRLTTAAAPKIDRVEQTREIPKLKMAVKRQAQATPRSTAAPQQKRAAAKPTSVTNNGASTQADRTQEIVVADAVRLLKWGKDWHELTELIARMAERPAPTEIRRILRTCRQRIESQLNG